jgi:hypothetical protein
LQAAPSINGLVASIIDQALDSQGSSTASNIVSDALNLASDVSGISQPQQTVDTSPIQMFQDIMNIGNSYPNSSQVGQVVKVGIRMSAKTGGRINPHQQYSAIP